MADGPRALADQFPIKETTGLYTNTGDWGINRPTTKDRFNGPR